MSQIQSALFAQIKKRMEAVLTPEFISSTKTVKGDTQKCERVVIQKIKEVLDEMTLTYTEASSQQSKDFRNVGGIGLNLEIKKTDSPSIYFNDTCPAAEIFYMVLFTGKEYKREIEKNIPPQVCYINGAEFLKDAEEWIEEYKVNITALKDKYARGENKKKLTGIMSVYPRPTYKADISSFLIKMSPPAVTESI